MLESLAASILNRFLGSYVSNLNYDQLKIGIWNGEVNLRNLKLRREALDKLDLPIDVLEGYLEELTLSIPWSNLKSKPVKVFVNNVYLLAVPKNEATTTFNEEEERAQMLKQRRLATAELLDSSQVSDNQATKKGDNQQEGFIEQLTTKIVDNVQLSFKNIHIRYEDSVSDPQNPFAAGVTLKELSALSTNGEWKEFFISEATNETHKLAKLESLSVYWNTNSRSLAGMPHEKASKAYVELIPYADNPVIEHQYVLKPVSGTGKIKLNKKYGPETPRTDVMLLFDELAFNLDHEQYCDALRMVDHFNADMKKQNYRKLHPPKEMTPKTHPKEFLQFAGKAVLAEVHDRHYRWTWDHFKKRRDQRLAYIDLYIEHSSGKISPEKTKQLAKLERELSFEDIRFYRSIAKHKMKRTKIKIDEKKKQKSSNEGWFSSWWNSPAKKEEEEDEDVIVITEEQKRELLEAIEYDEEKAKIAATIDQPKDTMKFSFGIKLHRGSFTLQNQQEDNRLQKLISLIFESVTIDMIQYVGSMKVSASLGDLRLYDGTTPGSLYPQLIGARKASSDKQISLLDIPSEEISPESTGDLSGEPFFHVIYELHPLTKTAEHALSLDMRHLEIIFNPKTVNDVMSFFKPNHIAMDSFNALVEAAGDTFDGFKQQTIVGLEYALEHHTTIDISANMHAPVIIIPENCMDANSPVMIIDAGYMTVDSELADPASANELKKINLKENPENLEILELLMYDKFHLHMSQTKVLIGTNVKETMHQLTSTEYQDTNDAHVIERIDMQFLIELCVVPGASQFTKIKVSGHLPLLSVKFSDSKYKILMSIIDTIIPPDNDDSGSKSRQSKRARPIWRDTSSELLLSDTNSVSSSNAGNLEGSVTSTLRPLSILSIGSIEAFKEEKFKFSFDVDAVTASIYETDTSGDRKLCELALNGFSLCFTSRPYDMSVDLSLKTLCVIDKITNQTTFPYLVTSANTDSEDDGNDTESKDLVNVKYMRINRYHPHYMTEYEGFDQHVDVSLSTLRIIITPYSILSLYNWIMKTFTSPEKPTTSAVQHAPSQESKDSLLRNSKGTNDSTIRVELRMESLQLLLNENGVCLGTFALAFGDLGILLFSNHLRVIGGFGNLTLDEGNATEDPSNENHDHLLYTHDDELIRFIYETNDKESDTYPGYDQLFKLRMGALHCHFTETHQRVLDFLLTFLYTKTLYDKARMAAFETAQQMQETETRFHFDIIIKSPVIIFPAKESTDAITANLGEFFASNQFVDVARYDHQQKLQNTPVSRIQCGIRSISLTSVRKADLEGKVYTMQILDDVNIDVDIEQAEFPENTFGPLTRLRGSVTDVHLRFNENQYKALLDVYGDIMKTLNSIQGDSSSPDQANTSITAPSSHSFGGSQHLSPNNTPLRTPQQEKRNQNESQVQVDMIFVVNAACLELLRKVDYENGAHESLSRFQFNQSELKLQTMLSGALLLEFQLHSMSFSDTRDDSKSQFREILPASNLGGPQFQIKLDSRTQDDAQVMDIVVTVDSPKIVLSLDYVLLLKNFLMSPFDTEQSLTEAQKYAKHQTERTKRVRTESIPADRPVSIATTHESLHSTQSQTGASSTPMKLIYRVNVIDTEIVCLAKPDSPMSDALVFSIGHLLVSQREQLNISVKHVHSELCRMHMPREAGAHFVEPFDMELTMSTSTSTPGHCVTMISLDVQPVILRLSYYDMMMLTTIMSKVMQVVGTESTSSSSAPSLIYLDRFPESVDLDDTEHPLLAVSDIGDPGERSLAGTHDVAPPVNPYIVMSKETLKAAFQGIQLTFIEDLHELPFVDFVVQPFDIHASDWTRSLAANVQFSIRANYFNIRNSHWEPLIEPWSFDIKAWQQGTFTKATNVRVSSKEHLNLNLTHTFLSTVFSLSNAVPKNYAMTPSTPEFHVKPYLIRNETGYPLTFWNMSDDAEDGDTRVCKLNNGQEVSWTFRDWRKRRERTNLGRNLIGVQIEQFEWESFSHIPLNQEGQQAYRLKPELKNVSHRLIVDIRISHHVKTVTFRGGLLLQNHTATPLKVTLVNTKRLIMSEVWTLEPGKEIAPPIALCHTWWVTVRPLSDDYRWSKQLLHWSDLIRSTCPKYVECETKDGRGSKCYYQMTTKFDMKTCYKEYPFMTVEFSAPIKLHNMLPFPLNLTVIDVLSPNNCTSIFLESGAVKHIHSMSSDKDMYVDVQLENQDYYPSERTRVSASQPLPHDGYPLLIKSKQDTTTCLRLFASHLKASNNSLQIDVVSPYLIINKTGVPVLLRTYTHRHRTKPMPVCIDCAQDETIVPFMFAYNDIDRHNRSQLSIHNSKWSDPLSFEAVGSSFDVILPSGDRSTDYHLGLHVEEGTGKFALTKIVTIAPRFVMKNNTKMNFSMREFGSDNIVQLDSRQRMVIFSTSTEASKWFCLRSQDGNYEWSAPFDIQDLGRAYVKVPREESTRSTLIQITVQVKEATVFIQLDRSKEWPYRIVNNSSVDITFSQEILGLEEVKDKRKHLLPKPKDFSVQVGESCNYSWDMPIFKDKHLALNVCGRTRCINFQAIGSQTPFRYKKQREQNAGTDIMSVDIIARDMVLELVLSDFDPKKSPYRAKAPAGSSMASSTHEGSTRDYFEAINVQHVINYSIELDIDNIGISVITEQVQEILYATIRGLSFKYTDSNIYQMLRLSTRWLQIDNQSYNTSFPSLLYPTTLRKDLADESVHPTFHVALDRVKDNAHGVYHFKLFSVLLQEISIEMDEDLMYAILDFIRFSEPEEQEPSTTSGDIARWEAEVVEPTVQRSQVLYYFEEFCIQPMKLNLSFECTQRANSVDPSGSSGISPLSYAINVFTMTVGNINDAPVKLNALMVENLRASTDDILSRIILHYREQVIYQVHKVVGSADFLGNPVGLFSNLSSGFGELFYEPYQGFIMSDRPQDLGIGLARGVGGFMKKSVFGITDSMSRITGSLGKGLAVATMDKEFQERRRLNQTRNKPRHAMYGVTQGVTSLGDSVASGIAGLVKRPIEGASEDGVSGFVGGIGKGLIGAVTKPVVGIFDLASNVTAGIRETTTVFDTGNIGRERLPRHIGRDRILTAYTQREALGDMWLKEAEDGKFIHDTYIAHCIASSEMIAILTYEAVIVVLARKLRVFWAVPLDDIVSCAFEEQERGTTLTTLYLRGTQKSRTFLIEEPSTQVWFTQQIQQTLQQRKEERDRQ